MSDQQSIIPSLIGKYHQRLLAEWLACQKRVSRGADTERGTDGLVRLEAAITDICQNLAAARAVTAKNTVRILSPSQLKKNVTGAEPRPEAARTPRPFKSQPAATCPISKKS
jgi:hypothetical protein